MTTYNEELVEVLTANNAVVATLIATLASDGSYSIRSIRRNFDSAVECIRAGRQAEDLDQFKIFYPLSDWKATKAARSAKAGKATEYVTDTSLTEVIKTTIQSIADENRRPIFRASV